MERFLPLSTLLLGLSSLFFSATVALAQQPSIIVSTNAPLPLLVDGLETAQLPAAAPAGSQVCIAATQHYATESERWTFVAWSHGPREACVTLAEPGVYRALYTREVLLHISSTIDLLQESRWVSAGVPTEVRVPPTVQEGERVRYRFQKWSGGETPFQPANRIAPLKPTTLEASWVKEYRIQIEGPEGVALSGSGWYADGASLVLQAPDVVTGPTPGERLKLAGWQSVGTPVLLIPEAQKGATTIKVDAPYTLKALYNREFLFVARNPGGVLQRKWAKEGDEVLVETPPVIEVAPERDRLVFKRWEGQEGLVSPKISGVITQPVELRAVYEHQYMVTVVAPYSSSGGGWQKDGNTATIGVPEHIQWRFIFKRSFVGFPGYGSGGNPTLQVLVKEPIAITALYKTEVDLRTLGFLFILPLGGLVLYFINGWVALLLRRKQSEERQAG